MHAQLGEDGYTMYTLLYHRVAHTHVYAGCMVTRGVAGGAPVNAYMRCQDHCGSWALGLPLRVIDQSLLSAGVILSSNKTNLTHHGCRVMKRIGTWTQIVWASTFTLLDTQRKF